jgi:hypothetical protein
LAGVLLEPHASDVPIKAMATNESGRPDINIGTYANTTAHDEPRPGLRFELVSSHAWRSCCMCCHCTFALERSLMSEARAGTGGSN